MADITISKPNLPKSLPNKLPTDFPLSTEVAILSLFFCIIIYGLLLGQNKVKTLALSVYVGIVLSEELGPAVHGVIGNYQLAGVHFTLGVTRMVLFILPLILLEVGRRNHGRGGQRGMWMTLILCVLTSALIVASGLNLLEPDTLKKVLDNSTLAKSIYELRLWWLAAVPLAVIGESLIKPKKENGY